MVALALTTFAYAQQSKTAGQTLTAAYAYARGDDSYLDFTGETYKADKKYVIVKLWNASTPLTGAEKTALSDLKVQLAKRNAEIVELEWRTEEELQAALKRYDFTVAVKDGKHINLKRDNFSLNTTSGNAVLVLEDTKPVSLCSGKDCEERLKRFFRLTAYN
jgi:hypothetical protein